MSSVGTIDTPVGRVRITMTSCGLAELHFLGLGKSTPSAPVTGEVAEQIASYFAGVRREFTLPVDLAAASDFTRRVLEATARIPYGETRTYGQIAAAIGMPGATQAVGNALGVNPVPIVVPCHRVVRTDGSMGWFTGGAHIKRALLGLEGVHFPEQISLPF
jgi:methylated-DNA-[protein]-cysteine S-methyltransferase